MGCSYVGIHRAGGQDFLQCQSNGQPLQQRSLTQEDRDLFAGWIGAYQRLQATDNNPARLLELGRAMRQWLDQRNWLSNLQENASSPPFVLEFRVDRNPDKEALRFLEVPWELLADADGHWAGNATLLYCPVRRIGPASIPSACSPHRLSLAFMAADPIAPHPTHAPSLRYEEEEQAIFQAAGNLGLDLIVEESGSLNQLVETVSSQDDLQVVHISCHGNLAQPDPNSAAIPMLFLETDEGAQEPVSPAQFAQEFGSTRPRLLFASACKTGQPDDALAHSFASSLVQRGWPAVLGWSGSVGDKEATRFAAAFYKHLARPNTPLVSALAYARHALITDAAQRDQQPSKDWHLARLYLGASDGGPVCCGTRARNQHPERESKAFLDAKRQVPVASRWEFVGRRRQLQTILRTFREKKSAGVLIHGLGRQGKSSLAARAANRLHHLFGHRTAVVFGRYDAPSILAAIAEALPNQLVKEIVRRHEPLVRDQPDRLTEALTELLEGPCREQTNQNSIALHPVLLVIDDFEQALRTEQPPPYTVHPDFEQAIQAVIRAFSQADSQSALLFTSRYAFTLPAGDEDLAQRLLDLPLPIMQRPEGRKQAEAKARALGLTLNEPERVDRIIRAAQGNPGLQDLLFQMLIKAAQERSAGAQPLARLDDLLAEMEQFIQTGQYPQQAELLTFLENLVINKLLGQLDQGERDLLRASTLFQLPAPESVLRRIAEVYGYAGKQPFGHRLYGLGLWERQRDPLTGEAALACNPLVRPHFAVLTDEEQRHYALAVVMPLFTAWGGEDGSQRPLLADGELTRLALLAEHGEILTHVAAGGLRFLEEDFQYLQAAEWAKQCLDIFERQEKKAPVRFYHIAGERLHQVGEVQRAADCLAQAIASVGDVDEQSASQNNFTCASVLLTHGRFLEQQGEVDAALQVFKEAERRLKACNAGRERSITLGNIARIRLSKGEVEQALKLHNERLQVFQELGDRRSRAVTLGDIARILLSKGEVEQALQLHYETLKVFQELGDRRSRAVTLGDIARILRSKGEVEQALQLHYETLKVFQELGDRRSRAVTLGEIASILRSKGEVEQALQLHYERLLVFQDLGDRRERAVTLGDIARILLSKGELEQALELHNERLLVNIELGDVDGIAHALWNIAQIEVQREQYQEAYQHLHEAYDLLTKLGRLDGICCIGLDLGTLLCRAGHAEDGIPILQRSLEGFNRLGQLEAAKSTQAILASFSAPQPQNQSPHQEE
jgi:tetratricopeptide (TPR) repeat protein